MKYYSLKRILSHNAPYNVIFGERSNGKTYSVLKYGLEKYVKNGDQIAIVRRWQDDFTGRRGRSMFDALIESGEIERVTKGQWTGVYYYASKWYLMRMDEDGNRITDPTPFALGFAVSAQEHDKSTSYPRVTTILFDEMITRKMYLPDEFVLTMNLFSTIIRGRDNVKIFMLGNTVNKYCPYFREMGLKHVAQMKPGALDVYKYGDSRLSVAVEYTEPNAKGKPSDFYFSFDNPKLSMITGGAWEIDIYPHLPHKYAPKDILFTYFIEWDGEILQCEIIHAGGDLFTYIHQKTSDLKHPESDHVFTTSAKAGYNYHRNILRPTTKIEKKIESFFRSGKVFYQDNETGEQVRNYLQWCGKKV